MNPKLRSALIVLALLSTLALLVLGFMWGFEAQTREVYTGYGERARENDYLAAGWMLDRLGLKVTFIENLDRLPAKEGTVFMPQSSRGLSDDQIKDLLEWMARGGSLVVTPDVLLEENLSVQDRLLQHFGVETRAIRSDVLATNPQLASARPIDLFSGKGADRSEQPETLHILMAHPVVLIDSAEKAFWTTPKNDVRMLHLRHGRGLLTVLSDAQFMSNEWLNNQNNGRFLWYLATGDQRRGEVLIAYSREFPPFLAIVARHGWPVLISLAALIAATIGFYVSRLGPILSGPGVVRRKLTEHFDAVGRFHWRQGHRARLVDGVRRTLLRGISRRHPTWHSLPPDKQIARLELLLGPAFSKKNQSRLQIESLVSPWAGEPVPRQEKSIDEKLFVEIIAKLERIRAGL